MLKLLALLVVIVVYACTFVMCNEKIDGGAKAGFLAVLFVVAGVVALLSWVMG